MWYALVSININGKNFSSFDAKDRISVNDALRKVGYELHPDDYIIIGDRVFYQSDSCHHKNALYDRVYAWKMDDTMHINIISKHSQRAVPKYGPAGSNIISKKEVEVRLPGSKHLTVSTADVEGEVTIEGILAVAGWQITRRDLVNYRTVDGKFDKYSLGDSCESGALINKLSVTRKRNFLIFDAYTDKPCGSIIAIAAHVSRHTDDESFDHRFFGKVPFNFLPDPTSTSDRSPGPSLHTYHKTTESISTMQSTHNSYDELLDDFILFLHKNIPETEIYIQFPHEAVYRVVRDLATRCNPGIDLTRILSGIGILRIAPNCEDTTFEMSEDPRSNLGYIVHDLQKKDLQTARL